MNLHNPGIRIERIRRDIEALAQFSSGPGPGCTRFCYTEEDREAREYLFREFKKAGLTVRVDGIGNIRARCEGTDTDAPPVAAGSHIDTVPHGGKFDGVLGVICGLEVLRVASEKQIRTKHPLELIIFVEEEGPQFQTQLLGSKILTGKLPPEILKTIQNREGITAYDAMSTFGLSPSKIGSSLILPGELKALIELHVEQGNVLFLEKTPVGIVERIAGGKWLEFGISGMSNHAGATPMKYRNDPLSGAAEIFLAAERIARREINEHTVATVGKILCFPNTPNVIPEWVIFTVDVRDTEASGITEAEEKIEAAAAEICKERGLSFSKKILASTAPTLLSEEVITAMEKSARALGVKYRKMHSGALHDAAVMGSVTNAGMIFVPSINGRSHVPEEETPYEDIAIACGVLLESLIHLAGGDTGS